MATGLRGPRGLSCFDRVFLASSGAEANEGAVKLARRWGRRMRGGAHEVIAFEQGFHGCTLGTMSASGKAGWDRIYPPMPTGFAKARLNDIASVERAITPQSAAVMIEFVQGEAGVNLADTSRRCCARTRSSASSPATRAAPTAATR